MSVAVVTDSTAYLPPRLVADLGIEVVPLYVVLTGRSGREGLDVSPADVARTLAVRGQQVTTSRPTPGDFVAAYRRRLDAGADRIVSVHLSMELSGTWDAARTAAVEVGEHLVKVVDTRSAAMGTGFAVLAAARAAAAGADVDEVAAAAQRTADAGSTLFVVDTLDHLRRGGRIGSAAAVLGTALAVKPVLRVVDGRIVALEKVRTTSRAVARLVQRVVELSAAGPVSLAVHHLAAPERAQALAAQLLQRVPNIRELHVSELGAALGAHVGPGAVGVVVDPSDLPSAPRGGAPDAATRVPHPPTQHTTVAAESPPHLSARTPGPAVAAPGTAAGPGTGPGACAVAGTGTAPVAGAPTDGAAGTPGTTDGGATQGS